MKRPKVTAEGVLSSQPGLAGLNPGVVKAVERGARPSEALSAHAAPGDREVIAAVQAAKRQLSARGAAAQHHGDVNEDTIEAELNGGVEDGLLAWWRHFHPPFVRAGGVWRPCAIDPGRGVEGSVDYIVQPMEGPSVLVEAKSVDGPRFDLKGVPDHQQRHLEVHVDAGHPAALMVTFRTEGIRMVCPWSHVSWKRKRTALAIYADDVDVRAFAVAPGNLVEQLLRIARSAL